MKLQKSSTKLKLPSPPLLFRRIVGHSMMPVLPPKTLVIGWAWFQNLSVGDIVIFCHDDKEKIKRIVSFEDDKVFVQGDHQDASTDSRHFGLIPKSDIVARVFWPRAPLHRAEHVQKSDS